MEENNKAYYSISEVCEKTELEPHVLRYWETEFSQLRPKKNRAGNRAYRTKDIEIVNYIKYLLYHEQYTIPGAKKKLTEVDGYYIPQQIQLNLSTPPQPQIKPIPLSPSNGQLVSALQDVLSILRS